jgi:2-oxo-4-hydroxy-4-carboxy-5-ureidoimidazoline decarboxylase
VSDDAPALAPVSLLDRLPEPEAALLLESCCGSRAWVRGMLQRRPLATLGALLVAADDVWWSLGREDWLEAFAHHPRIGEGTAAASPGARAHGWSADEQRGVTASPDELRQAIAVGNEEYERRFGYIYIVSAAGRSAGQLLTLLHQRLTNEPATELRVAAAEQAKITALRLRKLLRDG